MQMPAFPEVRKVKSLRVVDSNYRVHSFRGNLQVERTELSLTVSLNAANGSENRVCLFVKPVSVSFGEGAER